MDDAEAVAEATRVAGINLPAFVERALGSPHALTCPCVAGINLPAFVERTKSS